MTWYQWLIGGAEFVITWWCTDRLTHKKGVVPDWLTPERHKGDKVQSLVAEAEENYKNIVALRKEAQQLTSRSSLDFSRYERPPVYGALSAVQGVLGTKATNLAEEYMKTVLRTQMRLR